MPEIAEVYTMAGGLASLLSIPIDSPLCQFVEPINHPLIKWPGVALKSVRTVGSNGIFRDRFAKLPEVLNLIPSEIVHRGKVLAIRFGDCPYALHFHFGMSGRLGLVESKHTRVSLEFQDGHFLHYIDPRKFGKVSVEHWTMPVNSGLDVMLVTEEYLTELCKSKRRIRSVLTDQGRMAGIGNYLVNEILWKARINPFRPASTLSAAAIASVLKNARETIVESARAGGATLLDYFGLGGEEGTYAKSFNVYRKGGYECPRCGGMIRRVHNSGEQSSYFCQVCQPYVRD
jgi:formamidopyrimidine-DNA glycosylase